MLNDMKKVVEGYKKKVSEHDKRIQIIKEGTEMLESLLRSTERFQQELDRYIMGDKK